jgi:hypothetical protein
MQTPVVAPSDDPMLECYTVLGALAAATWMPASTA